MILHTIFMISKTIPEIRQNINCLTTILEIKQQLGQNPLQVSCLNFSGSLCFSYCSCTLHCLCNNQNNVVSES